MIKKIITERYYVEGSTFNVVDWEIYTYPVIEKWSDFTPRIIYDVLSTDFRRLKNSSVFNFLFSEAEKAYEWTVKKVQSVNGTAKQYFIITLVASTSIVPHPKLDTNPSQVSTGLIENVVVQPITKTNKTFKVVSVRDSFADVTDYSKFKKKLANSKINNIRKAAGVQRVISATDVLNKAEGFFPVPYWDNKQYSVGYGSFISYEDCQKLWKRMDISEINGKRIAHKLHVCGYKKANAICTIFKKHKGVLTETEAVLMRNAELKKFYTLVDNEFPTLPQSLKQKLTTTVYNTGWAGFRGTHGKKVNGKIFKETRLCYALRNSHYYSNSVWNGFSCLKTTIDNVPNVGLERRRELEKFNFFAERSEKDQQAFNNCYNKF